MKEKKTVYVFRIEYDRINENESWIAFIAACKAEEAMDYIMKIVGGKIRINVCGSQCRLDGLTEDVRNRISGVSGIKTEQSKRSDINESEIYQKNSKSKKRQIIKNKK